MTMATTRMFLQSTHEVRLFVEETCDERLSTFNRSLRKMTDWTVKKQLTPRLTELDHPVILVAVN